MGRKTWVRRREMDLSMLLKDNMAVRGSYCKICEARSTAYKKNSRYM